MKYEVILKQYPAEEGMPNGYWVAVCPSVAGCVTDGETVPEALAMVADLIHLCLEDDEPLDTAIAEREKSATLREAAEEKLVTAIETYMVEPKAMTEEELAIWPRFAFLAPEVAS